MYEFYLRIMKALAIKMTPIGVYGLRHLEVVIITAVVALALAFLFAKTKVNKSGVLVFFGILMMLLEVIRQFLWVYLNRGYVWSHFPWQLCSIPMFLCLVYPGMKKRRDAIEGYLVSFGFVCGIVAFIRPQEAGLFSKYLILTIFAIVWHGILLTLGIYMMMTSKHRSVRAFRGPALLYLIGAVLAFVINFFTKANLFYIGPSKPHLYLANTVYASHGWIVETIVMILVTMAAAFVMYFVSGMGKKK